MSTFLLKMRAINLKIIEAAKGGGGTNQGSECKSVSPCGVERPPRQKRGRMVAPCGLCGRLMRSDKLKQHLLSHARPKGRDSRGRFSAQNSVAPDGGDRTPCGSVSESAPCGGSYSGRQQEKDPSDQGGALEAKREAVRGLAQAIIDRLTELQCDKILGFARARKQPFTP